MLSTYRNVNASCGFSSRKSSSVMTRSSSGTAFPCSPEATGRQPKVRTLPYPAPRVIFCVQGAISPLLANIYLHYVLDLWALRWRQREATGDMIIVRYADDFIVGFQHESDARRFLDEMRERLVVLRHEIRRLFLLNLLTQHGHLGSILASATIK
jgi:hypothetical protein